MRSFALFTAFAGTLSFAATLHAQQPVGKLEGTITEKIGTRSVAATETGDLLLSMGGFRVVGRGQSAKIFSKVATSAKPLCGEANVVMEGVEGLSINDIDPSTIAGIAAYPDGSGAPPRYERNADCGLIVIWLRPKNNGRPGIMKGLGYNGY